MSLRAPPWIPMSMALLCLASPARAAWQSFEPASGLGMNEVSQIVQDSSGAMWFSSSSERAVTRYDGLRWQAIPTVGPMFALIALREGGMAGAFYFGAIWLARIPDSNPNHITISTLTDHLGNVSGFVEGPGGSIWMSGNRGLWSTGSGSIELPAGNGVARLASSPTGDVWASLTQNPDPYQVGPGVGVARYRDGAWTRYQRVDGLPSDTTGAIFCDRSGGTWIATAAGIARFDGQSKWERYTTQDGLPNYSVQTFAQDGVGAIWALLGTIEGSNELVRFDGIRWRVYGVSDGLPSPAIAMGADREGNLWFGTQASGVVRFDRELQRHFPVLSAEDPLFEDREGRIWFRNVRFDQNQAETFPGGGTPFQDPKGRIWSGGCNGVKRFENEVWHVDSVSAATLMGCVDNPVVDSDGVLWFPGSDSTLFWSFDDTEWRVHRAPSGFPQREFPPVAADRSGSLWLQLPDSGLARFEPRLDRWTLFGPADGLPVRHVDQWLEDRAGQIWVASQFQIARFDGSHWTLFDPPDVAEIVSLAQDPTGRLWALIGRDFYSYSLLWFDGARWVDFYDPNYIVPSGYQPRLGRDSSGQVWAVGNPDAYQRYPVVRLWGDRQILETTTGTPRAILPPILDDHIGTIWSNTYDGIGSYDRDRTAPQTVLVSGPARLTPQRRAGFSFVAGYGESRDIEFRSAVDGIDTTLWATEGGREVFVEDGVHTFEVWARDRAGNVDPTPARDTFEVDATPPTPILSSPAFGAIVRDTVAISGEAEDARFHDWRLEIRSTDSTSWTLLQSSTAAAPEGTELARFDTRGFSDGEHLLRFAITDTLGLTGTAQISVIVDNLDPPAEQSSPAVVRRSVGGDVYTTDGKIHLYFPPYALSTDDTVRIETHAPDSTAAPPAAGLVAVGGPFDLRWGSGHLDTPGVLMLQSLPDSVIHGSPALWDSVDATGWHRVGGTVDAGARRLSIPISKDGRYALFQDRGSVSPGIALSTLSLLPRVFSPSGGFASREVAITFSLGQAAPVTVRVFNRAGRLVREVGAGITLPAGANVLRWNGRDRTGEQVADGLYLVTVEALGETRQSTLAVVR